VKRFTSLSDFYNSKEWEKFREVLIMERGVVDEVTMEHRVVDEVTGKEIVNKYDLILHHIEPLTEENVNDYSISLNPKNIQIVSHKTHNVIHDNFGIHQQKQVFLVYGAPLSGKTSWVRDNALCGDLIVDIDSIWQCVSGLDRYEKPNKLKAVVFRLYDELYDTVKYRDGKWLNAYVIGGFPLSSERERVRRELHAREIFISTDKETCLRRLKEDRRSDNWEKYIEDWFEKFSR